MRLVKLKTVPIRVEGKFGAVIIEQDGKWMCVSTKPDTGCHSKVWVDETPETKAFHAREEGHRILLEKRHDIS